MVPHDRGDALAEAFEQERGRLLAVAHRMLGSRADAEDAVQEAWLRLSRQDDGSVDNVAGWLTTVVGRVCIDVMRSRRRHPEALYDDHPPELVVVADDGSDPEGDAVLAESVGLALLVVLDTLSPAERVAFVLHDLFGVPFDQIAQVLDRSTDASKMLASRARRKVRDADEPDVEHGRSRAVVDAFLAASRAGEFDELLRVLDPDVTWRSHTGRGVVERRGAQVVAARVQRGARADVRTRSVRVDGRPGVAVWDPRGRPIGVMACTVVGGRIAEIDSFTDARLISRTDFPQAPSA
ncbi:sigma-70 family RNA polymerase sigma factor [Luteipulveratus halotolerans]|uniref:RNA polymerase sigma70 factor n=1 Tax=Luteipulveratus halotolerans TaxID=1631356 RepID=A0A0L6CHA3_9MICO|nr:sigma-70 family RNA polymerase sigma factor [Luteipulveratus halotolerans]KNX37109.1 RNA polymerase sigma70 factor [Luteipulveratus halotolerans]